jgi:hypothetical protein
MSESAKPPPPPDDAAPDAPSTPPARPGINWHRVRVYLYSILIIVTMWFCATMLTIQRHPKLVVDRLLAELPYPSSTGKVFWLNRRTLEIDDLKLGDSSDPKLGQFFYARAIIVTASPFGLWRHHIAKVQVDEGQLFTKALYAALDKAGPGSGRSLDWIVGRLEITRGTVLMDNLLENIAIPVRLGVRHPIILSMLRLGRPDSSPEMDDPRTIEVGAVNISSPIDPTTPVFFLPLTQITFTYSEFWHHHIRKIQLIRPTMFLGEDLFWLTSQFKAVTKTRPEVGPESPWVVNNFSVDYGRLAVNAFGQPVVHFPFFFNTKVNDIRLDQLDQISAKSEVAIQRLDQDYPDYKVRIANLRGKLYFSWPPTDAHANNVVNTISIDEVSWNGIPAKDVSSTVTFDPEGVYGKLYGKCEGGQLNGNFEFYYTKGFTWNADFFANKVNCQPITQKVAGKYIDLTGELDGNIDVEGRSTEILKCDGALSLPNPGELQIKSMAALLDRIPADMISLKRDALKIAINAFQSYPYTSGQLTLNYRPSGGLSSLKLDGPLGKREFDIALHPYQLSDNAGDGGQETVDKGKAGTESAANQGGG